MKRESLGFVFDKIFELESKGWKRKVINFADSERMDLFSNSGKYDLLFFLQRRF